MKLDPKQPCIIRMQSNHIYIFLSETEKLFMEAIELNAVKLQVPATSIDLGRTCRLAIIPAS